MKVNTRSFFAVIFFIYWGLIGLSMATGIWDSSNVTKENNGVMPPEEITGTMTVRELLLTYSLNKETLYTNFKIPAQEPDTQALRDLAHRYGFEVENIREFVESHLDTLNATPQSYQGMPSPSCDSCQQQ